MSNFKIKLSLFLNYFVFAILLNSVGTVILQMQNNFSVSPGSAANLEGFKDGSIAVTSFFIASYIIRIGYKNSMLIGLAFVTFMCLLMPSLSSFLMIKALFTTVGVSFALIKVSVFATLGIITKTEKEHISLMNFLESFFGSVLSCSCGSPSEDTKMISLKNQGTSVKNTANGLTVLGLFHYGAGHRSTFHKEFLCR